MFQKPEMLSSIITPWMMVAVPTCGARLADHGIVRRFSAAVHCGHHRYCRRRFADRCGAPALRLYRPMAIFVGIAYSKLRSALRHHRLGLAGRPHARGR